MALCASFLESGGGQAAGWPALLQRLASVYRPAALFLTNKENFVAETGSPAGTEINSDRQLWNVAGNLAMVYRILIGIEFTESGIQLHPVVLPQWQGTRTLNNFHYRDAVLSFRVEGFGSRISTVNLDGKSGRAFVPAYLKGNHQIVIQMAGNPLENLSFHVSASEYAPDTPVVKSDDAGQFVWNAVPGATEYQVYRDGKPQEKTKALSFSTPAQPVYAEYQVSAWNAAKLESFLSAPVSFGPVPQKVEAESSGHGSHETLQNFSGSGFVQTDRTINPSITLEAETPAAGEYQISFRYSNGSGPVNTDNKCAIRTLFVDGKAVGPIVLPQRGTGEWSNWGNSNGQVLRLTPGKHRFELRSEPYDQNMNGDVNRAMIDFMSLQKIN